VGRGQRGRQTVERLASVVFERDQRDRARAGRFARDQVDRLGRVVVVRDQGSVRQLERREEHRRGGLEVAGDVRRARERREARAARGGLDDHQGERAAFGRARGRRRARGDERDQRRDDDGAAGGRHAPRRASPPCSRDHGLWYATAWPLDKARSVGRRALNLRRCA
jgi:hypothetical protein